MKQVDYTVADQALYTKYDQLVAATLEGLTKSASIFKIIKLKNFDPEIKAHMFVYHVSLIALLYEYEIQLQMGLFQYIKFKYFGPGKNMKVRRLSPKEFADIEIGLILDEAFGGGSFEEIIEKAGKIYDEYYAKKSN